MGVMQKGSGNMDVKRFKFVCGYDGSNYSGWQVQPDRVSIQAVLEETLRLILKRDEPVKVHGSGRTDQGVHARGQVFHVDLCTRMVPVALMRAMNARLPLDIRILSGGRVSSDFHARRSAMGKEYRYFIWNGEVMRPDVRLYHAHVVRRLDLVAMRRAMEMFVGTHDFAAFTANPQREVESTVRTIYDFELSASGPRVVLRVRGNGFLYKMVRSMAGFLMRVGGGAERPEAVGELLRAGSMRTARVPSAPGQGLFLWRVWYRNVPPKF